MPAVIVAEELTKFYGRHRGIADLDLEVVAGEVFGYLGPNGAGKTTTIRLLLDLIRPTSGRSVVLGMDPRTNGSALRRRIGYLPGELALYPKMTGRQLLTYLAGLRGMASVEAALAIAQRLDFDPTRPIKDLSRGNKQKLGIIQAFMHRPDLLILDEPTSGLDPLMQREFHRMVREVKAEGRTVFLSSHVLGEVERIADRIGIIRDGRMAITEGLDELKAKAVRRIEFHFSKPVPEGVFEEIPNVQHVHVEDSVLTCTAIGSIEELVRVAAPFGVSSVVSHEADLEELFLRYYEGSSGAG